LTQKTYFGETDVNVRKVRRYRGVIKITQSIENNKTAGKGENKLGKNTVNKN
jgi:hypothetical protein